MSRDAVVLLQRRNYRLALEYALLDSKEQTIAVLRELEFLGIRAQDLALSGLSDAATLQLLDCCEYGMHTEFYPLLLRAAMRLLQYSATQASGMLQTRVQAFQVCMSEWADMLDNSDFLFTQA